MKNYLEFENDKSSKFWEITFEKMTLTIRYGKIDSGGKTVVKEFESNETAQKEYDKLVKAKTKKGYISANGSELKLEKISLEEAKSIVKKYAGPFKKDCDNFIGGWWHVEEAIYYSPQTVKTGRYDIPHIALIHGDLEVDLLEGAYNSLLIVLGNLKVKRAIIGCQIIVIGNVTIEGTGVFESMGDNGLYVGGNLTVSELLELDHHFKVTGDFDVTGESFERGCDVEDYSFHLDCYNSNEDKEDWAPDYNSVAERVRKNLPIFGYE